MICTLITGATGRTGRHVVSQLRSSGVRIRVLARNPQSAEWPPDVEVNGGDLELPETLDRCLDGVDSVFLVWMASPDPVPAVIERIAKHTRRIVFLSSPYRNPHPLFQGAQPNAISSLHAEIERLIRASGLEWAFVRPGMFSANALFWWAGQIRAGDAVRWPYAHVPTAPIDERDIAAVAVRALCDGRCAGGDYLVTGPESLSHLDQVSTIADVLGRPLRFEEITPEDWHRELPPLVTAPIANMLLAAWDAAMGHPALVTSTVREVTGMPPRTFRDWVADNTEEFQPGN